MTLKWSGGFLLLLVFFLGVTPAFAKKKKAEEKELKEADLEIRTNTVFGIYPPMMELDCVAGQRVTTKVKVDNPGKQPAAFFLETIGTTAIGAEDLVNRPISTLPATHLSRHLTIESEKIILPGKSHKDVAVYIDVPASLRGTHYTGLTVVNTSPSMDIDELHRKEEYQIDLGVGMQPSIASTIKCHIVGTLEYSYALDSIKADTRKKNQPLQVYATFKNTGNAEMAFIPTLILLDKNKKVKARMKGERRITIVPGGKKEATFAPVYKEIPLGKYMAIVSAVGPKMKLPPLEKELMVQ